MLRVVFVASSVAPWHGWSRVHEGLARYRGSLKIIVDAVGDMGKSNGHLESVGNAQVRYHGTLKRAELDRVFSDAHVGISSLAMHRIGLREGCVLKTREYTARGLPFVYAYDDSDLRADDPFCLRVAADESPLEVERVLDFARGVANRPGIAELSRAAASTRMDWRAKIEAFSRFADQL
jgi:hypothetical protein